MSIYLKQTKAINRGELLNYHLFRSKNFLLKSFKILCPKARFTLHSSSKNKDICTGLFHLDRIRNANVSIHLNFQLRLSVGVQERSRSFDLLDGMRNHLLSGKTGIYGHEQNSVNIVQHVNTTLNGSGRIDRQQYLCARPLCQ